MDEMSMDDCFDASDWKGSWKFMKEFDESFACAICFGILTAPVTIKSCSHTFCSACIRGHLNSGLDSNKKKCPKCHSNASDGSLIPQHGLALAADCWRKTKTQLVAKYKAESSASEASTSTKKDGKRRLVNADSQEDILEEESKGRFRSSPALPNGSNSSRSNDLRDSSRPSRSSRTSKKVDYTFQGFAGEEEEDHDEDEEIDQRPSKKRRSNPGGNPNEAISILDSDDDEDYDPSESKGSHARPSTSQQKSIPNASSSNLASSSTSGSNVAGKNLSQCPICQWTYTPEAMDAHFTIDSCKYDGKPEPTPVQRGLPKTSGPSLSSSKGRLPFGDQKSSSSSKFKSSNPDLSEDRVSRPNYNLMKEPEMKKLLRDAGLSDRTDGATDKAGRVKKLVERHGKFVDLFNANIDLPLAQRSSKRSVIDELNDWERNQEIKSGKRSGGLSRSEREILEEEKEVERAKETSSKTWARKQEGSFAALIEQARESRRNQAAAASATVNSDSNGTSSASSLEKEDDSNNERNESEAPTELDEVMESKEDQVKKGKESEEKGKDVEMKVVEEERRDQENGNEVEEKQVVVEEEEEGNDYFDNFPPSSQNIKSLPIS